MKGFDRHKKYIVLIKEENGVKIIYTKVVEGSLLNRFIAYLELSGK